MTKVRAGVMTAPRRLELTEFETPGVNHTFYAHDLATAMSVRASPRLET